MMEDHTTTHSPNNGDNGIKHDAANNVAVIFCFGMPWRVLGQVTDSIFLVAHPKGPVLTNGTRMSKIQDLDDTIPIERQIKNAAWNVFQDWTWTHLGKDLEYPEGVGAVSTHPILNT